MLYLLNNCNNYQGIKMRDDDEPLELSKRTYCVKFDDNVVNFSVYGDDDDLNTLDLFIGFLLDANSNSGDNGIYFGEEPDDEDDDY